MPVLRLLKVSDTSARESLGNGSSLYAEAVEDCLLLEEVLAAVGASRMVVAHTVQDGGINSACGEMVWRVDVGLDDYYGGPTQALGIQDGTVTIFK